MNTQTKTILLFSFFILALQSCTTYHMTTESLVQQFVDSKPEVKRNLLVVFPIMIPTSIQGNDLYEVRCLDPQNKEHTIRVTNRTGIRITTKDKKKCTFYFDTLLLKDSTINGSKSHFVKLGIHPINLNNIEKIEL